MAGDVSIHDFRQDVQDYINKHGLDINKDSLINKDNGELANLLSASGVDDVSKLYNSGMLRSKYTNIIIGSTMAGAGIAYAGQKLTSHEKFMQAHEQYGVQQQKARQIIEEYNASLKQMPKEDFWNNSLEQVKKEISTDKRYSEAQKRIIIQKLDESIAKREKTLTQVKAHKERTKQVAQELKSLFKKPFLLKYRNFILNGSIVGTGLAIASTLFFGYKAATTSASQEKLAFQQ